MKLPALSSIFCKVTLATLALGGALFLAGAPAARAEDCNHRVNYTEWRYHEAIEHFGPYSRQARHWAHERDEALRHCHYYWR